MFDPDGIHRVLLNIASNALDAVKELKNGKVTILVDHDMKERMLQVSISDNGQGILPELREKGVSRVCVGQRSYGDRVRPGSKPENHKRTQRNNRNRI